MIDTTHVHRFVSGLSRRPVRLTPLPRRKSSTLVCKYRPDIFFHLLDVPSPISSTKSWYALSLLSSPPRSPASSTILGWLPPTSTSDFPGNWHGFKENFGFRKILHAAVQQGLCQGTDDIQLKGALQLRQGWMHIHDDRRIPPVGRIGDPDDILATVLVRDSKVLRLPISIQYVLPATRYFPKHTSPCLLIGFVPGMAQQSSHLA